MIDIRYHIYSLAAVFFALAVGIVIGTSFEKSSPRTYTEKQTISRYVKTMHLLKAEIEAASDNAEEQERLVKSTEEFSRVVLPKIIKNKLLMHNVAIIQTGDYDDLSGSVKRALELSGATVTSITDISRSFDFGDMSSLNRVMVKCKIMPPMDEKEARNKFFRILAQSIAAGKHPEFISAFEQLNVAKFSGDYKKNCRFVVLVGGSKSDKTNTSTAIDSQLIEQLNEPNIITVGCEPIKTESSYISTWHKNGIATVDNADSAIGQVSLIYALKGETDNFGVKDTANRLIPSSLEQN